VSEPVLVKDIFDRLRQAAAATPGVLEELCRDYVVEARSTMAHIGEAVGNGNAEQLRDRAHYLKGSSMMIGARELAQCCATLEAMGRESNLGDANAELDRTLEALKAVEGELSREVGPTALP
jgi:HPt (histidine-containing phosphotransfer) domain-containing protein